MDTPAWQQTLPRRVTPFPDEWLPGLLLRCDEVNHWESRATLAYLLSPGPDVICRISFPVGRTTTCPGVGFLPCFIGSKLCCKNESFDAYQLLWSHLGTIKRPLVPCSFRMALSTGGSLAFWIHVISYGSKMDTFW